MAQKFVGIDLGHRKVKLAVISGGLRGAQVLHVWEQEVGAARASSGAPGASPGDAEEPLDRALDTALRMIKERGLGHLPTGVALPSGAGSYRVLSFPFTDVRQIAQAINFELEGQFPMAIEELVTDHLPIKGSDGRGRALVVAVKRTTIEHVVARLQLAKIDLKLVTTGALAIAQALASTPVPPAPGSGSTALGASEPGLQPVSLVVDFGHKNTELIALGNDGPIAARSMHRGGHQLVRELQRTWRLDRQAAELALMRDGSVNDPMVRRALQPLLRELEHTRQWVRAEFGCVVVELRLCGGVSGLRGLEQWLTQETGLATALVAPKEGRLLSQVEGRDWSHALIALGAAVATARRPLIQLHDAYDSGGGEGAWFQQHFSTVAALGVAILAFAGVDTLVGVKAAERERGAYATELEQETRAVFGEPLMTTQAIQAELTAAKGGDTSRLIPKRGALEVLELVTRAATPKGGRPQPEPSTVVLPPGYTTSSDASGATVVIGPDGSPVPMDSNGAPLLPVDPAVGSDPTQVGGEGEGEGEGEGSGTSAVADRDAGILADDDLLISSVEIRELKVELSLSASRATAQDRLGTKLKEYACIRGITKGSIKERNERQSFDMSLDHDCFTGSLALEGTNDDGEG